MTGPRGLALAAEQFGEELIRSFERLEAARRELPPARGVRSLIDDVAVLGLASGDIVADVGAWGGLWSERLSTQYDCRCVALDLSPTGLSEAVGRGVPGVVADAESLPLRSESIDLVWCQDTMSCLEDPEAVLREFARVLRPGGGLMLSTALTTSLLEPLERHWFLQALESPAWWSLGRTPIDDAVDMTGFEIVGFEVRSPETSEALIAADAAEVSDQLARIAQLRRARPALEEVLGSKWYARWLAWSHWQAYLFLGKIETAVWMLRKPFPTD